MMPHCSCAWENCDRTPALLADPMPPPVVGAGSKPPVNVAAAAAASFVSAKVRPESGAGAGLAACGSERREG
jgi:hypothetical protein